MNFLVGRIVGCEEVTFLLVSVVCGFKCFFIRRGYLFEFGELILGGICIRRES